MTTYHPKTGTLQAVNHQIHNTLQTEYVVTHSIGVMTESLP